MANIKLLWCKQFAIAVVNYLLTRIMTVLLFISYNFKGIKIKEHSFGGNFQQNICHWRLDWMLALIMVGKSDLLYADMFDGLLSINLYELCKEYSTEDALIYY